MNIRRNKSKDVLHDQAREAYIRQVELARAQIEQKAKFINLTRCLNDQRREEAEYAHTVKVKEDDALLKQYVEQEQHLATAIEEVRRSEINEKKKRQYLRQSSQELRDLEKQLSAAYTAKQQVAQIAEKEAYRLNEKLKDKQCHEILRSAWCKNDEYRNLLKEEEIHKKAQYRQELQDQMILQDKTKRFAYEEFLRDKKLIDDIVQRIYEENERDYEERMCKMKKTQQEIDAFKQAQRIWKEKKRQEIIDENRRIEEYLATKASDDQARQAEKDRIEEEKIRITNKLAQKVYEVERQKREREDVITQLREEELKEEADKRHKADIEHILRSRIETRRTLLHQMQENVEQRKIEAEEDRNYREQLLAKLAEEEKVEQMSNEKRRRKLLQLKKDAEKMIADRRQRQAEHMQLEKRILEEEKTAEEERLRFVQEERIRMLQEHATKLIGYMPRGLLQPGDLQYLDDNVREAYGRKRNN